MRTEKLAVRVEPKFAAKLRKMARKRGYFTLSAWLRALLEAELQQENDAGHGAQEVAS